jgi:methyltransferase-like protein
MHRVTGPWEPEVEQALWRLAEGDRIAYQQLVDFMVWRRFRDSLLCHAGRNVSDHIDHSRLRALRFRPSGPLGEQDAHTSEILPTLRDQIRAEVARASGTALAPQQLDAALRDLAAMGLLEPARGDASAG